MKLNSDDDPEIVKSSLYIPEHIKLYVDTHSSSYRQSFVQLIRQGLWAFKGDYSDKLTGIISIEREIKKWCAEYTSPSYTTRYSKASHVIISDLEQYPKYNIPDMYISGRSRITTYMYRSDSDEIGAIAEACGLKKSDMVSTSILYAVMDMKEQYDVRVRETAINMLESFEKYIDEWYRHLEELHQRCIEEFKISVDEPHYVDTDSDMHHDDTSSGAECSYDEYFIKVDRDGTLRTNCGNLFELLENHDIVFEKDDIKFRIVRSNK
jgi:hypothetical protein